jgi:hypothetical protein
MKFSVKKNSYGKRKLRATIIYRKDIASRFHDIRYYMYRADEEKNILKKESQKARYATPKQEFVTRLLMKYRELGKTKISKVNYALRGIAVRNTR